MSIRSPWCVALSLIVLSVAGAGARGQSSQPAPAGLPTMYYADPAFGFELHMPAGWSYDRTRFQQFKNSIGLLRGRDAAGQRGLQIVVFRSFDMKPFEDWVIDFGKALAELTSSPRVDWETWRRSPHTGAILTYSSKMGAIGQQSHCLCVPFDPSTVWTFAYTGNALSAEHERQVRQEFDQLTASLRIHYDPAEAERLAPAYERGQALIERVRKLGAAARLDETEYAFEIILAGKPIGYFTRRVSREEYVFTPPDAARRFAKDGLRIRERSWRFADDGTVRHSRLDCFSSFDGKSELIESEQTLIPAPDIAAQELLITTDQVIREAGALFSSFTTSRDESLPEPSKPIEVGPVYLDLAWARVLPGLLLGQPPEKYAVAIYSPETRALLAHTIELLGERELAGHTGAAYAFEFREGFIAEPGKLYTDRRGNLLRLEAGELVIERVERDQVERKYGPRRDEACGRFGLVAE